MSATAARSRRRMRLRSTAPPVLRVTVKPILTLPAASPRDRACSVSSALCARRPDAAALNSTRRLSRSTGGTGPVRTLRPSGRKLLAAARPAGGDDLAARGGGHAGAKAMAALAHELARLIGAFHGPGLRREARPSGCARACLAKDANGRPPTASALPARAYTGAAPRASTTAAAPRRFTAATSPCGGASQAGDTSRAAAPWTKLRRIRSRSNHAGPQ